ncbi:MAG: LacI family DNA-binding transcriptional regulator [Rhodoglobus sp.]
MDGEASATTQRPTLAAVAALAGVSGSTASLAFSGAGPVSDTTRAKVLTAAQTLGYAGPDPRAQSLRRGRSGIIGIVIEERLQDAFRDPMSLAMLDGIADETGNAGAGLLLLSDIGGPQLDIRSAPMDAVILVGCSTRLDESVAVLRQRGMPVVAIEADDMPGVLSISLDNRDATARLARHLLDLGHESVAVVALPLDAAKEQQRLPANWDELATSHTTRDRLRGLRDVYPGFGGIVATRSSIEAGRAAGLELLEGADRPTAVVAQSDLLAMGVIRAAEILGIRIPEELSVVGFDGAQVDAMGSYDLTTVIQPAVEKGRAAGRAAVELVEGGSPTPMAFTSELHIGTTTAARSQPERSRAG